MTDLILSVSPEVKERLENLAFQLGRTVDDCTQQALMEYLNNWEDYLRAVADLEAEEDRPILRAVND